MLLQSWIAKFKSRSIFRDRRKHRARAVQAKQHWRCSRVAGRVELLETRIQLDGTGLEFPGQVPTAYDFEWGIDGIVVADFNNDGAPDLATANGSGDRISVLLNQGNGIYEPLREYFTPNFPQTIVSADLDGDGYRELICDFGSSEKIGIFTNRGDGTFDEVTLTTVSSDVVDIDVAYINDDARIDIVLATTQGVSVLLNVSDGNLQETAYPAGGGPTAVKAADVNHDGHNDLVVALETPESATLSILINAGDGTYGSPVPYSAGDSADLLLTADLDQDGAIDVVAVTQFGSASGLHYFRNHGDGTFEPAQFTATPAGVESIIAFDCDGDNLPDLITADRLNSRLTIRLNAGSGTFGETSHLDVPPDFFGSSYDLLTSGDFDQDGRLDLIGSTGSQLHLIRNLGHGNFAAQSTNGVGIDPTSVTTADVDKDGQLDVVVTSEGAGGVGVLSVLRSLGAGRFAPAVTYPLGEFPGCVGAADLDKDGFVDLFVANFGNNNDGYVSVLWNQGDGSFEAESNLVSSERISSVTQADVNGDGLIDLMAASSFDDIVLVLLNQGQRVFSEAASYAVDSRPQDLTATDYDGDSHVDIVVANQTSGTISLLRNNGDGTFAQQVTVPAGEEPIAIRAADLDGDGDVELITADYASNTVSILRRGTGDSFQVLDTYSVGELPTFFRIIPLIQTVDINQDGRLDVLVATVDGVTVLMNKGAATFARPFRYSAPGLQGVFTIANLDNSTSLDMITVNSTSASIDIVRNLGAGIFAARTEFADLGNSLVVDIDQDSAADAIRIWTNENDVHFLSILRNDGHGFFDESIDYEMPFDTYSYVAADFTGDGLPDLAAGSSDDESIVLLKNLGDGAFADPVSFNFSGIPSEITAGDVDGDGDIDLVATQFNLGVFKVLKNDGAGRFATPVRYFVDNATSSVLLSDVDGDGDPDVITLDASIFFPFQSFVSVSINQGNGTFVEQDGYAIGDNASIATSDLDADGLGDLISINRFSRRLLILRGLGNGALDAHVVYGLPGTPTSVVAKDINADGQDDIALTISETADVLILYNLGNGVLGAPVSYEAGSHPFGLTATDLNGDGLTDLVFANAVDDAPEALSILLSHEIEIIELPGNLTVSDVTVTPDPAVLGNALHVAYTIENDSDEPIHNRWLDSIYLSRQNSDANSRILLKQIARDIDLDPHGSLAASVDVMIPPLTDFVPGEWTITVQVNSDRRLRETDLSDNRQTMGVTIQQQITQLSLGQTFTGSILNGQALYFAVDAQDHSTVDALLSGLPANGTIELYIKQGGLPSRTDFDRSSTIPFADEQYVNLPESQAGPCYILVYARTLTTESTTFSLKATNPTFGIRAGQTFGTAGNTGNFTLHASGTQLDRTLTVQIRNPQGQLSPASTYYFDGETELYATFDLRNLAPGVYDVIFTNSQSQQVTFVDSLTVVAGSAQRTILPKVIAPSSIRRSREFTFAVEWINDSLNDVQSPLLTVGASVPFGLHHHNYDLGSETTFLGISSQGGPPGILLPGQRETLRFWGFSDASAGDYVVYATRTYQDATAPFDWDAIRDLVPSTQLSPSEFAAAFAELINRVGPTTADYLQMLAQYAALLPPGGSEFIGEFSLVELALEDAIAATGSSISGQLVTPDLSVSFDGLSLVARNLDTGDLYTASARHDGSFVFPRVQPGEYELTLNGAIFTQSGPVLVTVADQTPTTGLSLPIEAGAQVSGQIFSLASGLGVPQARISLFQDGSSIQTHTGVSDADGRFSLSGLSAGVYTVIVDADGFARQLSGPVTIAGNQSLELNVTLAAAATIQGQLTTSDGQNIATRDPLISARKTGSASALGTFEGTFTGNQWSITNLPAGTYDITFTVDGYAERTVTGVIVSAGQSVNVPPTVMQVGATVRGIVSGGPSGLPAGLIVVGAYAGEELVAADVAAADGSFVLTGLPAGTFDIRANPPAGTFGSSQSVTVVAGQEINDLSLSAQTGAVLQGTLRDSVTNSPLAGIQVEARRQDDPVPLFATTDSAGAFVFTGLNLGSYTVSAAASNLASKEVTVVELGEHYPADLLLTEAGEINGRVITAEGTRLSGVKILLLQGSEVVARTTTNANGDFQYILTEPGIYNLIAVSNGTVIQETAVSVANGQIVEPELVAENATLQVTLVGAPSTDRPRIFLTRTDTLQPIPAAQAEVDSNQRVTFQHVSAGTYQVDVFNASNKSGSAVVQILPGQSAQLTLNLVNAGIVSGHISGVTVPASAQIFLTSELDDNRRRLIADTDGTFTFDSVAPGVYSLTAVVDGYLAIVRQVNVAAGNNVLSLTAQPSHLLLTGTVICTDGLPIAESSIVVRDAADRVVGIGQTNADGTYSIDTAVGTGLKVFIAADGYVPTSLNGVTLTAGTLQLGVSQLHLLAVSAEVQTEAPQLMSGASLAAAADQGGGGVFAGILPPEILLLIDQLEGEVKSEDHVDLPQDVTILPCCVEAWTQLTIRVDVQNLLLDATNLTQAALRAAVLDATLAIKNLVSGGFAAGGGNIAGDFLKKLDAISKAAQNLGQWFPSLEADAKALEQVLGNLDGDLVPPAPTLTDTLAEAGEKYEEIKEEAQQIVPEEHEFWQMPKVKGAVQLLDGFFTVLGLKQVADAYKTAFAKMERVLNQFVLIRGRYNFAVRAAQHELIHFEYCQSLPCDPEEESKEADDAQGIGRPASVDPNDIIGPAGFGPERYVSEVNVMPYTIRFENDAALATAPAATVTITQTLDADLDWTTFRLGDIGFGETLISVPQDSIFFQTRVDLTATRGVLVDVTASIEIATGGIRWDFTAIDPATGEIPEDPFTGFLPPNVNAPEGEGFVSYSIRPKSSVTTGSTIDAVAEIVFDVNEPIDTPAILHTIDAAGPTSQVLPLNAVTFTTDFTVTWSGSDDFGGSGIATYDIFVSDNDGSFVIWQLATAETSGVYSGSPGHTYEFISVATDNVGHRQLTPTTAQATITVALNVPPVIEGITELQFVKNQSPLSIGADVDVTDSDENLGGGTLQVRITNVAFGKKQKRFDVINTSSLGGLGTVSAPQVIGGFAVVTVQLGATVTAAQIESALQSITFSTSGKGLKVATRSVHIQAVDAAGAASNDFAQTIRVLKKLPASRRAERSGKAGTDPR